MHGIRVHCGEILAISYLVFSRSPRIRSDEVVHCLDVSDKEALVCV